MRSIALTWVLLMSLGIGKAQIWESCGPFGGDRHFIYQDPNQSQTWFTGGAGGFVHRSTDGGESWTALADTFVLGQSKVEAVLVRYGDPDRVLANAYNTIGMLSSADGGDSWQLSNQGLGSERSATSLASVVTQPDEVWMGIEVLGTNLAAGGGYRSTDFGQTWNSMNNGLPLTRVTRIFSDGTDDYYACTLEGLFHWDATNAIWEDPNLPRDSVSCLEIHPQNDSILWAGTTGDWIFKSTDKGDSWNPLPRPTALNTGIPAVCYAIAADPQNPDVLLTRLYQSEELPFYPQSIPNAITGTYFSTNAGNSWTLLSGVSFSDVRIDGTSPLTSTAPIRSSRILMTGGGQSCVLRSDDGGINFEAKIEGIAALYSNRVHVSPFGQVVNLAEAVAAVQNSGSTTWSRLDYPNAAPDRNGYHWDVRFDPTDSSRCLIAKGEYAHSSADGKGIYVYGLGNNFSDTLPGTAGAGFMQIETGKNWDTLFLASHSHGVWESFNGGNAWLRKEDGLGEKTIQKFHVSAQTRRPMYCITRGDSINWFSAGSTEPGGFYRWDPGSQSWNAAGTGLPGLAMADLWVSDNDSLLWACTFNDGLYRSTDAGGNWTPVSLPFANPKLFTVEGQSLRDNFILIGDKNRGVWYSEDGGSQWQHLNDQSLLSASINDLELTGSGRIYAATLGGSILKAEAPFLLHTEAPGRNAIDLELQIAPNPSRDRSRIHLIGNWTAPITARLGAANGSEIWTQEWQDFQAEIELGALPAGWYWLQVSDGIHTMARKVLVE